MSFSLPDLDSVETLFQETKKRCKFLDKSISVWDEKIRNLDFEIETATRVVSELNADVSKVSDSVVKIQRGILANKEKVQMLEKEMFLVVDSIADETVREQKEALRRKTLDATCAKLVSGVEARSQWFTSIPSHVSDRSSEIEERLKSAREDLDKARVIANCQSFDDIVRRVQEIRREIECQEMETINLRGEVDALETVERNQRDRITSLKQELKIAENRNNAKKLRLTKMVETLEEEIAHIAVP